MKNTPIVFGIETALKKASLSLLKGETEIASHVEEKPVSRAEDLLQTIDTFLVNNNFNIRDIDLIAASVGPGSFTGIRVGIATVQALSMGTGCRCMGVSVLDALALRTDSVGSVANIISVVSSGRENLIWKTFSSLTDVGAQRFAEQVGNTTSFADYVEHLKADNFFIIAEPNAYHNLKIHFENSEQVRRLKCASDNVSNSIALFGYLNRKSNFSTLKPQYLLPVDIG
jgi:tRNA threonylcarbamoyl adenosine modification protein YeaZ